MSPFLLAILCGTFIIAGIVADLSLPTWARCVFIPVFGAGAGYTAWGLWVARRD